MKARTGTVAARRGEGRQKGRNPGDLPEAGIVPGSSSATISAVERKSITPAELARLLSPERLGSYEAVMGTPEGAVLLYEWNLAVSAALFETLGAVEVIVRNAFHRELAARHAARGGRGRWYEARWLDPKGRQDVDKARERATRGNRPELAGKVIAELSFGFWRYLATRRYQTTAWPALRQAFPRHPGASGGFRGDVDDRMQRIHTLRNRIAHHEPVFRRNLEHDHRDMLTIVGWISTDAQTWVASLSRFDEVLAVRPR